MESLTSALPKQKNLFDSRLVRVVYLALPTLEAECYGHGRVQTRRPSHDLSKQPALSAPCRQRDSYDEPMCLVRVFAFAFDSGRRGWRPQGQGHAARYSIEVFSNASKKLRTPRRDKTRRRPNPTDGTRTPSRTPRSMGQRPNTSSSRRPVELAASPSTPHKQADTKGRQTTA